MIILHHFFKFFFKKISNHDFGLFAEKYAIFWLSIKGYKILEWRFKSEVGEIDIIALKKNLIVFVEVKSTQKKQINIELVLRRRQIKRIFITSQIFLKKNYHWQNYRHRYDLIVVKRFLKIKHYCNFIS